MSLNYKSIEPVHQQKQRENKFDEIHKKGGSESSRLFSTKCQIIESSVFSI